MIKLYTAIFETRQYLVAAFAFDLACAVSVLATRSLKRKLYTVMKLQDGHRENLRRTTFDLRAR